MAIVRNLMVRAGADFSGLQRGMRQAQGQIRTFSQQVTQSMGKLNAVLAGVGATVAIGAAIKDAMAFETSMNQVNRIMGDTADEFAKWAETTAAAFGYSKLEAAKAGATYGNLLSTFSSGADDTRKKTEELMKATAVVSAATGRTMEDTFERIRSGLLGNTEAIEDLGINVNVAMIESTNAFKQFANGASWDQLSFQVQQQIRYMAILEQATQKYGTTVGDSTSVRLGTFVQALNNMKLALGQAFLPILNVALPVLTVLANKLASVMGVVTQFVRALVGKKGDIPQQTTAISNQTAAVNNLGAAQENAGKKAKKAAKEAKKASRGIAGFDQINQLSDPSSGGGASDGGAGASISGGAGGVDLPTVDTKESEGAFAKISKGVRDFANKVKKFFAPVGKFLKQVWQEVSEYIKAKIEDLVKFWNKYGGQFVQAMKNIWTGIKPIVTWLVKFVWDSIKGLIDGVITFFKGLIKFIAGAFTGDWKTAFSGIKDMAVGAFQALWNFFNLTLIGGLKKGLVSLIKTFTDDFAKIAAKVKEPFTKIGDLFKEIGTKMYDGMKAPFKDVYNWFRDNVVKKFSEVLVNWKGDIAAKSGSIWTSIKGSFSGAYNWFKDSVVIKFYEALVNWKNLIANKGLEIWNAIKGKFSGAYDWFRDNVARKPMDALNNLRSLIANAAGSIWSAIKGKFTDVYGWFKRNVTDKISLAFSKIKDGLSGGLINGFKAVYNRAVGFLNSMIRNFNSAKGKIPFIKGKVPDIPTIPALAKGGITNGPTLALIGDNPGGKEVVSPLDRLQDMIGSAVGTAVMTAMQFNSSGGSGGGGDIILNIDGRNLARIMKPRMDNENQRIGSNIKMNSI
jgi:hypothetical protein